MPAPTQDAAAQQNSPTVAAHHVRWSLRTRLALFIALAIAVVISSTTYLQSRVVERAVEAELLDTSRLTALAIADDLELREDPLDRDDVSRTLQEFIESLPEFGSITVITIQSGQPAWFASTASAERADVVAIGRQAMERKDLIWGDPGSPLRILAVPLIHDGKPFGAVAITVSFDAFVRLRNTGRVIAVWATLLSAAALFLLVELLVRWLIHRPIDAIRATVSQVAAGELSARAPVVRDDEIGVVAAGLNHMLAEIEDLHEGLQQRIAQATQALQTRNRELLEMYQQMFQLREELGRVQQLAAVGETTSAVAHQIGTPLNLVSGHIQLLIAEQGPASPVTRRLQVAEEQIGKVTAIVRDLLERSRRRLERERVDLGHLLRRMCILVQPALASAGVQLVYAVPEGMPDIDADAAQLELALLNVVSNALDAMPEGGQLTIRASHADHQVTIEVIDTGTGMDAELVSRVFDPWVTTKPAGKGTGLGLSIARTVIVEHGGHIRVDSTPGSGTTFTVDLPCSPTEAPTIHA